MSTVFDAILKLAKQGKIDNKKGFKVSDIISQNKNLNADTVKTFLPKHAKVNKIYFKRIVRGKYIILNHFMK